jgi:hypothetical protein
MRFVLGMLCHPSLPASNRAMDTSFFVCILASKRNETLHIGVTTISRDE